MNKAGVWLVCIALAFLPAVIAGPYTTADDAWFRLIRPSITPPSFVFPIVWTILYTLIGCSLALAWTHASAKVKKHLAWSYGFNLVLNAFWTPLFFGLHAVGLAFICLLALFVSACWMYTVAKVHKTAAYLLIPYLVWLVFAGLLNFLIILR